MYKVGDEVLIKAEIMDIHEGLENPYFVQADNRFINWVSEDKIIPMDKTYADGLNDAWELAKKIVLGIKDGGFDSNRVMDVFGFTPYYVLREFTVAEAIAKIETYEKEKEIKVGDVVSDNCSFGLVTRKEGGLLYVMMADGSCGEDEEPESWHKTGKHIDIEGILKQIGE